MTTFRLATEADDTVIRSLLRNNTMPTWVDLAIEREPSFFAGKDLFGRDWAVIAEEGGEVVGMYSASVMPVHVDGRPERLGYLSGLRVNPVYRRRIRYLRDGYSSIRRLAPVAGSLPWWFTVVASENTTARRLLESGLPGFPTYDLQGEYVTFAVATARGKRRNLWRRAVADDVAHIMAFHNEHAARLQCSPVLSEEHVRRIGVDRFFVCDGGVAALWDQRTFKQIVARGYRRPLRRALPLYNLYARLFRRIPLPREGGELEQTFIAFLALAEPAASNARALLEDLLSHCETPAASLGLHAKHPLIEVVESLKPLPYPACVYAVTFEGAPPSSDRPMQPEAALL
jgi:hypothetical protein